MLSKSLLFLAMAAFSVASPLRRQYTSCRPNSKSTIPILPSTGNDEELASPPDNVELKKIGLGHGIQNYTCAMSSPDDGSEPTLVASALGAIAVLYDITEMYPGSSRSAFHSVDAYNMMPVSILASAELPINLDQTAVTPTSVPATSNPFPAPADLNFAGRTYPFLGHHYFNAEGVPTFDLRDIANLFAVVKKDDAVPPPSMAYAGPMGTGTVAWLKLSDKGGSEGVEYVYRVNTAGGKPHACSGEGETFSVSYTAMYWFYG